MTITLGTMGSVYSGNLGSPNYKDCSVDFGTARAGRTLVMFMGGDAAFSGGQLGESCVIDPAGDAISVALIGSTDASPEAYCETLFYGAVPSDIAGTVAVRVDGAGTGIYGRFYWMVLDGATDTPKEVIIGRGEFTDQIDGDVCFFFASGEFNHTTGADAPDTAYDTYGSWDTKVFRNYSEFAGDGWDAVHTIDGNNPWGLSSGADGFRIMQLLVEPRPDAYTITAEDIGSYELTGTDATLTRAGGAPHYLVIAEVWEPAAPLLRSLQLPAQTHTYELAGTDATQTKSEGVLATRREFAIASAPYAVFINETTTGREYGVYGTYLNEAGAPPPGVLEAYPGSYTLTGTAATLTKTTAGAGGGDYFGNRYFGARYFGDRYWGIGEAAVTFSIAADAGNYTLTGTAATPEHGWKVTATTVGAYSVTGTVATPRHGWKIIATTAGAYALTGTPVNITKTGAFAITALAGGYALTGTAASTLHRWKITATSAGAYTLAGTAATLRRNLPVIAGAGNYTLTGTAATPEHGWKVTATTAGSYALTGTAATPTKIARYTIDAGAGSYALTGTAASTLHRWKSTATTAGSYALTGTAATLTKGKRLTALAGSYTLTGTAASVLHRWKTTALAGSYALAGTAAGTYRGRKTVALTGSYTLTGTAATVKFGRRIEAEAGSYVLTGTDVFLDFSAFVPIPVAGLRVVYADDESRAVQANFAGAVPRIVHATPPRIART